MPASPIPTGAFLQLKNAALSEKSGPLKAQIWRQQYLEISLEQGHPSPICINSLLPKLDYAQMPTLIF